METELLPPTVNPDSAPYWDGAREGRLMIRKCSDCGATHFLPRHLCPECWSDRLEWIESAGRGTVHSFTVIRRASVPEYSGRVPYVLALIDLEEGPRMMANIVGDDALETALGDPVRVVFETRGKEGAKVPQFQRKAE